MPRSDAQINGYLVALDEGHQTLSICDEQCFAFIHVGDRLGFEDYWLHEAGLEEEIGKAYQVVGFGWTEDRDEALAVVLTDLMTGLLVNPMPVSHLVDALTSPVSGVQIWTNTINTGAPLSLDR